MPKIEVYCTQTCPYCRMAEALLDRKGVDYSKIFIDGDSEAWSQMEARSHRKTVPQIFIGEHHVGGFDDLSALNAAGELDSLLEV
ncbi:MAG: glutaredoxin 3 [Gammaproteobacteria bacterium]|jgi:glutaredoxin 3|nr:glutaredoxin 3 [Gammaproteobacteria bacterium]MBT7307582.1 glutaredoxin 3 [Gammaproteobacteria bacterium]